MEEQHWKLGDTSSRFESRGDAGEVSEGTGDHGGVSYGVYQLSSRKGAAAEFVKQSRHKDRFKGLVPGTDAFSDAWRSVAQEDPGFGDEQHQFVKKSHVDPIAGKLSTIGIKVDERGPAAQDMVWSMSVQYRGRTLRRINEGLREAFGDDVDPAALSDVEIVRAVHKSKLLHVHTDFASSDVAVRKGLEARIVAEEVGLVRLAETGTPGTSRQRDIDQIEARGIQQGSPIGKVISIQGKLRELNFFGKEGLPIATDGDYGKTTRQAVENFQLSVGLPATGEVGALTMHHLNEQIRTRQRLQETGQVNVLPDAFRLDNGRHPDHSLFVSTRKHVTNVDGKLGRQPHQHTDNIASALVVQARAESLSRIDKVWLSPDGTKMWAEQFSPRGEGYDWESKYVHVMTNEANTPMEQSGTKWPEAMRMFEQHEQQETDLKEQRLQERMVERSIGGPSMSR